MRFLYIHCFQLLLIFGTTQYTTGRYAGSMWEVGVLWWRPLCTNPKPFASCDCEKFSTSNSPINATQEQMCMKNKRMCCCEFGFTRATALRDGEGRSCLHASGVNDPNYWIQRSYSTVITRCKPRVFLCRICLIFVHKMYCLIIHF